MSISHCYFVILHRGTTIAIMDDVVGPKLLQFIRSIDDILKTDFGPHMMHFGSLKPILGEFCLGNFFAENVRDLNTELTDLRIIICLRKSEVTVERIVVRNVIEKLMEHGIYGQVVFSQTCYKSDNLNLCF